MNLTLFEIINILANFLLLILLFFYFFYLRNKEKALNSKENKIDADYHKIIDDTLARERKIIDDTAQEASQIISSAQYISQSTQNALNQALAKLVANLEQGAAQTSQEFVKYYFTTLNQLTNQSLTNFQTITKELEDDLQKQLKQYQITVLPSMEKEIGSYRETRLKEVENSIARIIQKVSQEVLNKTISVEDHEKLIIETLEKAKTEGIFD